MSAFHFGTLTPELILDALASCDFYLESGLTALNSYENRVYQFVAEDKRRYVVKFYRPERWSQAQIDEEHGLAAYLAEQEVSVAMPLVCRGQTLHQHQGFLFAIWSSVGGRHIEPDNLDQLEAVGHQLGRWHSLSPGYPLQHRAAITFSRCVAEPCQQLRQMALWPAVMTSDFARLLQQLVEALRPAFSLPFAAIPLHGDCHIGNVLWRDGLLFVDLDDSVTGPAIQDLWMLLSGEQAEQRLQLDTLLAGYEEFCEFDVRQLQLIEPLRTARMISHLAWVGKRWADPAFPIAFPWFATEAFWLEQYQTLQQQLVRLKQPPLALTSGY